MYLGTLILAALMFSQTSHARLDPTPESIQATTKRFVETAFRMQENPGSPGAEAEFSRSADVLNTLLGQAAPAEREGLIELAASSSGSICYIADLRTGKAYRIPGFVARMLERGKRLCGGGGGEVTVIEIIPPGSPAPATGTK
ncbi:MAG: hypothetical protein AB7G93_12895 [Bdellovibrionales bacterium]